MNLKDGVNFTGMDPSMWYARAIIDDVHRAVTGESATITSARRKKKPGGSSLHPEGKAIDVRVWALPGEAGQRDFARQLRLRLGPDFDVVVEGPAAEDPKYQNRPPHVHVEWDPQ